MTNKTNDDEAFEVAWNKHLKEEGLSGFPSDIHEYSADHKDIVKTFWLAALEYERKKKGCPETLVSGKERD